MIIIAGSSHPELAASIAEKLGISCINANTKRFEDQELRVQLDGCFYEEDVVIIQSTSKPANDHLMELLLIADTVKRAGARRILCVIPYLGYSRQDRPSYSHGPISASLVARLMEAVGLHRVLTLDLHSRQIEGFFNVGVQNLISLPLYQPFFPHVTPQDYIIVSPDVGGLRRAQEFSTLLGLDVAVVNKSRLATGECQMSEVIGNVKGKNCILVDDIIDTGGTICKAAALLLEKGAIGVTACVTHAVLSGDGLKLIEESPIETLYVTNSINQKNLPKNTHLIPIDTYFADALAVYLHKEF